MKIKEVIVVEGKHDSDTLKRYFDCDTIETSGTHLSKTTLELLKQVNENRGIIVFTDPDYPGEMIRKKINEFVPNAKNAFIPKAKAKTSKKVGVEHASKEDLEETLSHLITYHKWEKESISKEDLIDLNLNGSEQSAQLRAAIGDALFLGKCNAKTLWKRLNMLQITKEQLERIIECL